jgi:hypothetical protein
MTTVSVAERGRRGVTPDAAVNKGVLILCQNGDMRVFEQKNLRFGSFLPIGT